MKKSRLKRLSQKRLARLVRKEVHGTHAARLAALERRVEELELDPERILARVFKEP